MDEQFAVVLSMDASEEFASWVADTVADPDALDPFDYCVELEDLLGHPLAQH